VRGADSPKIDFVTRFGGDPLLTAPIHHHYHVHTNNDRAARLATHTLDQPVNNAQP
jgi:hypothetical protein